LTLLSGVRSRPAEVRPAGDQLCQRSGFPNLGESQTPIDTTHLFLSEKKTPNIRAAEGWGVCGKARLIIIPVEMVPEPNSLPSNKSGVDIATSFLIHAYYLYNSLWQFDAAIENHRF
jgi:hypothetical protein